jgi:hypothetical protein
MPPLSIRRQVWRNTKPWRRFPLFFLLTFQNLQLTGLIKLNRLCSFIVNRQALSGYNISNTETMLCLGPFSNTYEEFLLLAINYSSDSEDIAKITMISLVK